MKDFLVLSEPRKIYKKMIEDIKNAKKSIYLETYIYSNDKVGRKFREALIEKARQGVKVFLLIDALGAGFLRLRLHKILGIEEKEDSAVNLKFFSELINLGGKVKFFKEIRYVLRMFSANHERNHRKLLIIDEKITHISSINITEECLDWRELTLRFEGPITEHFLDSFRKDWKPHHIGKRINSFFHKGFEIIMDIPGGIERATENRYSELINGAKKEILIEGPYLVPSIPLRRALSNAVRRGVNVRLLIPNRSDMEIMDVIRDRYLGYLYRAGIEIYYYKKMLHSKLMIIDNSVFILGSSNLDYRSFRHNYEINLIGRNREIIESLRHFFIFGVKNSKRFNYPVWKNRSSFRKVYTLFLGLIEEYL